MNFDLTKIFTEMEIQGLTEPMLAMKAGVNVAYVNRIRRGIAKNPTPKIIKRLADALKLDMRSLHVKTRPKARVRKTA